MDIMQVVAIGIIAAILSLTIKKQVPEMALMISLAASVLIFFIILPRLAAVFDVLSVITSHTSGEFRYVDTLIRIVGIAYIAEFGAQVCKDAGEGAIASKIELSGKALIMVMSAPIIFSLLNLIMAAL
ncbi:MAG: stage III sporulation protein AD [Defluviitaleaceae bacterium]|nr:stage III sporulation protein AD [Defluviitaleaceae bacterium]